MAWNDGDGHQLSPDYGNYYLQGDSTEDVPLYGSADYKSGGKGALLATSDNSDLGLSNPSPGNLWQPPSSSSMVGSNQFGDTAGNAMSALGGSGSTMGAVGGAVGTAANIYESSSHNTNTGSAVMSGVASGASAGMAFGPWGAVIGGVVGGLIGLFGSKSAKKKEKKAFQQYEQAQVLPYQQQQANYLQKEGLLQKAISNYSSGYTPGGFQYRNGLFGSNRTSPNFKTPTFDPSNQPNFNVAPPNVVPGKGDPSMGIAPYSLPNSGVQVPPSNNSGMAPSGLTAPTSKFGAVNAPTEPTAPDYTGHKADDQSNVKQYAQNYVDFMNQQRQYDVGQSMNSYMPYFGNQGNG